MRHQGALQLYNVEEISSYLTDTGAADAYAVAQKHPVTAYTAGLKITFKAVNANTGTSTLAVDGLAVKTIKKNVSSNLVANDILANQIVTCIYDGTNFQMMGSGGTTATGITVGVTTITSGTDTRIPFNDSGIYNEDAGLTYAKTTDILTVNGGLIVNGVASQASVFNENGVDADFRIESDTKIHMFFVDASVDRIGINHNAPTVTLDVVGQARIGVSITNGDLGSLPTSLAVSIAATGTITTFDNFVALSGNISFTAATTIDYYRANAVVGGMLWNSAGTSTLHTGDIPSCFKADLYVLSSTVDYAAGIVINRYLGASTVTNLYGLYITTLYNDSTVTNYYPIYQGDAVGTNSFGTTSIFYRGVVINENGGDEDTRIEGDTDINLFFADASTDRVGIGLNNPTHKFHVNGNTFLDGTLKVGSISQDDTETKLVVWNSTDKVFEWRASTSLTASTAISSLTVATATNTINNADYAQNWQWNTLSSNTGLLLSSTSTAAASNSQILFASVLTGANGTSSQTTKAGHFENAHTGTGAVNIGIYVNASGGANNYALQLVDGSEGTGKVLTSDSVGKALWQTPSVALSSITVAVATNTIDNVAYAQEWKWDSLAGGTGMKFSAATTAAASNTQKLVEIALSGANGTASQTTTALSVANTHSGTTSVNVAIKATSSGATTDIAVQGTATGGASAVGGDFIASSGTSDTFGVRIDASSNNGFVYGIYINGLSGSGTLYGIVVPQAVNNGFSISSPTSKVHTSSFAAAYTKATENNYTLTSNDFTVAVDNGANNWTVIPPDAEDCPGRIYVIKRFDDSSTGTITIDPTTSNIQDPSSGVIGATITLDLWQTGDYTTPDCTIIGTGVMIQSNSVDWEVIAVIPVAPVCA